MPPNDFDVWEDSDRTEPGGEEDGTVTTTPERGGKGALRVALDRNNDLRSMRTTTLLLQSVGFSPLILISTFCCSRLLSPPSFVSTWLASSLMVALSVNTNSDASAPLVSTARLDELYPPSLRGGGLSSSKLAVGTSGARTPELVFIETATVKPDASKVETSEGAEGSRKQQHVEMRIRTPRFEAVIRLLQLELVGSLVP